MGVTRLAADVRADLIAAAREARAPGACLYLLEDGEPGCVVAQFALRRGVGREVLAQWDRPRREKAQPSGVDDLLKRGDPHMRRLAAGPVHGLASALGDVLQQAQGFWDDPEAFLRTQGVVLRAPEVERTAERERAMRRALASWLETHTAAAEGTVAEAPA